jgi:hypothetical protein
MDHKPLLVRYRQQSMLFLGHSLTLLGLQVAAWDNTICNIHLFLSSFHQTTTVKVTGQK